MKTITLTSREFKLMKIILEENDVLQEFKDNVEDMKKKLYKTNNIKDFSFFNNYSQSLESIKSLYTKFEIK